MKLESSTSVFNMGDTSIRVNQVVEVYRVILNHINNFMRDDKKWQRNTALQEEFYSTLLKEIVRIEKNDGIELFRDFKRYKNYRPPSSGKIGMRGRTLTNGLVKTGLINSNRTLSDIGYRYLNNSISTADRIEEVLGLDPDNLVYLRQFLKLRIYSHDSDKYFYNFRFALKFLTQYSNVPQNDFLKIVLSIKPNQTEEEIHQIIANYSSVSNNEQLFEDFYTEHFSNTLRSEEELSEVKQMFISKEFTDENFIKYFSNRDSNETALLYKDFVLNLIELKETRDVESYNKIKKLSRDAKIKKAFGSNKLPFTFKHNESIEDFFQTNEESQLLNDDHFKIYLEFIFSKHNDLIREYSDMCKRTFEITGLISFKNGLVNVNDSWILKPLIEILADNFQLTGENSYEDYEQNNDSLWFKDITTEQILKIDDVLYNNLMQKVGQEFGVTDQHSIIREIDNRHEREFKTFIENEFPVDKVIKILEKITDREDEDVYDLVTDNATIPTIFEYILTIAWYHLSEKDNYKLSETFHVTLDGNKLPLSHRAGGAGDIEIITDTYALLIEATLMDKNTQRRGELEPVIRHSINFTLEQSAYNTQTIFIANEIDENVINIFRSTQFIQLEGTVQTGTVDGLNIFALTTKEIIQLLKLNKSDSFILETINSNLDTSPTTIKPGWRQPVLDVILN